MALRLQWIVWLLATAGLVGYLAYGLLTQSSSASLTFLPGVTTHGHYQIEMQCQECHTPGMGVLQNACTKCHADELERATDTHPRSKFTDPGKAHLVKRIDGRLCISCHQEHVPDRTLAMGLSLPADYCWHCHQEVGEQRPSHQGLAYDSCATAGCHNYHDNRALFENFLVSHHGEPEVLDNPTAPQRTFARHWAEKHTGLSPLAAVDQDAPDSVEFDKQLLADWASTAHAAAGVNCTDCHQDAGRRRGPDDRPQAADGWSNRLTQEACQKCHDNEVQGFLAGRHGMRLSVGLDPMTPGVARLPMKHSSFHNELTCVSCHGSHRFDTRFAAVNACLNCHNDSHSLAYKESSHFQLWEQELSGDAAAGTGVSCATCHMPREKNGQEYFVQHNQNNNLRPNEKMVRTACANCHGLQFTLDSLADAELVARNFRGRPASRVESIDMAKAWSDERVRQREQRKLRRSRKVTQNQTTAGRQAISGP